MSVCSERGREQFLNAPWGKGVSSWLPSPFSLKGDIMILRTSTLEKHKEARAAELAKEQRAAARKAAKAKAAKAKAAKAAEESKDFESDEKNK